MKRLKVWGIFKILASIWLWYGFSLVQTGCAKEYSYEGGDTTSTINDSVAAAPPVSHEFPDCSLCDSSKGLSVGEWNFRTGNSYLCGNTTNAGFVGGTTFFTFFGPSACSIDTGLVFSVYLPIHMDHDVTGLTTETIAFYYYDHHAPKDIFISDDSLPFSLTISSYVRATGICIGTFQGTVYRANGDTAHITDGHFQVKLK
jgi:hypothetical protein